MVCPFCDQIHPDSFEYCPTTGKLLKPISLCVNCGEEIEPDWETCPFCDYLLKDTIPEFGIRVKLWGMTYGFWVLVFLGLALAVLLLVFIYGELSSMPFFMDMTEGIENFFESLNLDGLFQ